MIILEQANKIVENTLLERFGMAKEGYDEHKNKNIAGSNFGDKKEPSLIQI